MPFKPLPAAIGFIGCLGYAAYTHSWPWWLISAAAVSFVFGIVQPYIQLGGRPSEAIVESPEERSERSYFG